LFSITSRQALSASGDASSSENRGFAAASQAVQQVLQPKNTSVGSGPTSADGAVTSIDVSRTSDFLICGYYSGRIALWDIMGGNELKVLGLRVGGWPW
jgi:WD40 repeat protein